MEPIVVIAMVSVTLNIVLLFILTFGINYMNRVLAEQEEEIEKWFRRAIHR